MLTFVSGLIFTSEPGILSPICPPVGAVLDFLNQPMGSNVPRRPDSLPISSAGVQSGYSQDIIVPITMTKSPQIRFVGGTQEVRTYDYILL